MYSKSEEEKKFETEKKGKSEFATYAETLKDKNDRELLELQVYYAREAAKTNETIKKNVQFWFYASIAIVIIGFVLLNK